MPPIGIGGDWFDLPGSYHNKAHTISFADGHVEDHRWLTGNVCQPPAEANPLEYGDFSVGFRTDYVWMMAHSTAPYP